MEEQGGTTNSSFVSGEFILLASVQLGVDLQFIDGDSRDEIIMVHAPFLLVRARLTMNRDWHRDQRTCHVHDDFGRMPHDELVVLRRTWLSIRLTDRPSVTNLPTASDVCSSLPFRVLRFAA